jgi:hypothetical protein
MRIFEDEETWGGKINFVDQNDVVVGFDAYQSCCESFGYFFTLSGEKDAENIDTPTNLEEMVFDTKFFQEHDEEGWGEGGGQAVFRLLAPHLARSRSDAVLRKLERETAAVGGRSEVFLHLYNHHNGYYSHGFDMKIGGEVVHSGGI